MRSRQRLYIELLSVVALIIAFVVGVAYHIAIRPTPTVAERDSRRITYLKYWEIPRLVARMNQFSGICKNVRWERQKEHSGIVWGAWREYQIAVASYNDAVNEYRKLIFRYAGGSQYRGVEKTLPESRDVCSERPVLSIIPYDNLVEMEVRGEGWQRQFCWERRGGLHVLVRAWANGDATVAYIAPETADFFTGIYPPTRQHYPHNLPASVIVADDPRAFDVGITDQCSTGLLLRIPLPRFETETTEYLRHIP